MWLSDLKPEKAILYKNSTDSARITDIDGVGVRYGGRGADKYGSSLGR
jgi:hypothetical protein